MTTNKEFKLIQFILQELKNSPEDRERFNSILKNFEVDPYDDFDGLLDFGYWNNSTFDRIRELEQIQVIRTALSRTKDGKAVIGAFENETIDLYDGCGGWDTYLANYALSKLIHDDMYNGLTLKQSLQECNQYFEEVEGEIKLKI